MTQLDFWVSQFHDDKDRDGPQNIGLPTIYPLDVAEDILWNTRMEFEGLKISTVAIVLSQW
jgi:hypothetical protein